MLVTQRVKKKFEGSQRANIEATEKCWPKKKRVYEKKEKKYMSWYFVVIIRLSRSVQQPYQVFITKKFPFVVGFLSHN